MSKNYLKVSSSVTLKDAIECIQDSQQNCVLVVDEEDFLEGILTYGDIRRCLPEKSNDTSKGDSGLLDVCRKCPYSLYIQESCLQVILEQCFIFPPRFHKKMEDRKKNVNMSWFLNNS